MMMFKSTNYHQMTLMPRIEFPNYSKKNRTNNPPPMENNGGGNPYGGTGV
jgi:hypothetical protein